jgi:hypothetical protein
MFLDGLLHPVGASGELYLSAVVVESGWVELRVGDAANEWLAAAGFNPLAPSDLVVFRDPLSRPAGVLVSEAARLAPLQGWSRGEHRFSREQTAFATRATCPLPDLAVQGFLLDDGEVLAGDVWLLGGDGVTLSVVDGETPRPDAPWDREPSWFVRVDVTGDPLFRRALCGDAEPLDRRAVRRLRVRMGCREVICHPDATGHVRLDVGTQETAQPALRIRPSAGRLDIGVLGGS